MSRMIVRANIGPIGEIDSMSAKTVTWVDGVGGERADEDHRTSARSAALVLLANANIQRNHHQDIREEEPHRRISIVTPSSFMLATQDDDWEQGHEDNEQVEHDENVAPQRTVLSSSFTISRTPGTTVEDCLDRESVDNGEPCVTADESQIKSKKRKQQKSYPDNFERTRFKDIIGHGAVKLRIEEILLPMALPPIVADTVLTGIRALPASILLYGPPGCGKVRQKHHAATTKRVRVFVCCLFEHIYIYIPLNTDWHSCRRRNWQNPLLGKLVLPFIPSLQVTF
jgi:SpoVK/Ycf46/Vps4 family AAA+-type ATPase